MKFIGIFIIGYVVTTVSSVKTNLSPEVQKLCDEYFNWKMKDMPEFATFVGIHDYDDLLDDMSSEEYLHRFEHGRKFIETIDIYLEMYQEHKDQINLQVMKEDVMTYVEGYDYRGFLLPVNFADGPHVDTPRLFEWMNFKTENDYEIALKRLSAIEKQIDETIDLMKEGMTRGIVNHEISMKGVDKSMDEFDKNFEDSPYRKYFTNFPDSFSQEAIDSIQSRAKEIIENSVSPAYGKLRDYVKNDYKTRPNVAVTSIPNGKEFYDQLIKFHISSERTPEAIHQTGLDEVERINSEMEKIVKELGYDMDVKNFSSMIKNDPENFFDNPDDLMDKFREYVYDIIMPKIPEIFINVPKAELAVVADPSPDGPPAYYLTGAYDGSRPGVFYVNTYNYDAQPKYEMMTLSLHEGNPGHHLQNSHNLESPSIPYFRSVMDDRKYGTAPSRFPMNSCYTEGWGLYSESLGFDMNLYDNLLERYGHYSFEMFRACRLVVDTGMHALGWSRQEAIDFMYAHTAMALVQVQNEIDRYITWPGQALAYKSGELKFRELRQKAEDQLGELYDIKEFHDVILESYGPMSIVEQEVDEWIQNTLEEGRKRRNN